MSAMRTLCVIIGRAGSKGLPSKNALPVAGRPMVQWTVAQALAAQRRGVVDRIVVSTDGRAIADAARAAGAEVIDRPADLAGDAATVDAAVRHAVQRVEAAAETRAFDAVVILYANVPKRPADLVDRALAKLAETGCDSVQSVCPVGKTHPYWMKRLGGEAGDALLPYEPNAIYRRQDLPPVYMLDGGIIAVRRTALFTEHPGEPHAFLGDDRRGVVTAPGEVVDVDDATDLAVADARLREMTAADAVGDASTFAIRGRTVARNGDPFVIAELGVNHDGLLDRALPLVDAAAEAGADAVKTQLFDAGRLLSAEAELAAYQETAATDLRAMLDALQLDPGAMQQVRDRAHAAGLAFIVTPFSVEQFDAMRSLQPDAVKIASPDCVNAPLIEAMGELDAPMLISIGAATGAEWQPIVAPRRAGRPTAILHCVSAYPTPADQAGLAALADLRDATPGPVGYSDHTTSPLTGAFAVAAGATLIEKHLTHDTGAAGPDHAASFDPAAFAEYVRLIRDAAAARRGPGLDDVAPIEQDVRRVSRQSVCALRDLPAGHTLGRDDLTLKRPGVGLPAAELHRALGRRLAHALRADHLIRPEDLQRDEP